VPVSGRSGPKALGGCAERPGKVTQNGLARSTIMCFTQALFPWWTSLESGDTWLQRTPAP
jgi:hypothetical protein